MSPVPGTTGSSDGAAKKLRVLVCGGRDYDDSANVWTCLESLPISEVCHGAAPGADRLADYWVSQHEGVKVYAYPADWTRHGKAAGPIRNQKMLDEFKPDMVIAFPGGRGTAHMVTIARAAGVRVWELAS